MKIDKIRKQKNTVLVKEVSLESVLTEHEIKRFRDIIYTYYQEHKRIFSWRLTDNPYHIIVSEIMLQQTQTERVKEKYEQFIGTFPTLQLLAQAPMNEVIALWQGLGYNRRAMALKQLAERIVRDENGCIPTEPAIFETFRGIGPATAASICAFAYNSPTVFIETNIRAVYIHSFFSQKESVADSLLYPLVEATLDRKQPRQWYYALMDYGVMLKKQYKNPSRRSAHYNRQSKFEGSDRQVRGLILKMLVETPVLPTEAFLESIQRPPEKIRSLLEALEKEGFIIMRQDGNYCLMR